MTSSEATAPASERTYTRVATIGGASSAHLFRRSLHDVAVGPEDAIYALGDDQVRVFGGDGTLRRAWSLRSQRFCLAVGSTGRVYVGSLGQVDVYEASGSAVGGFGVHDRGTPAAITSLAVREHELFVADAAGRIIRRYDTSGVPLGLIGDRNRTRGFMLPNGSLDLDVTAEGVVYATDPGRHRVTAWRVDGTPVGQFGKFGHQAPEDFVGCCNPVNLALTPEGKVVTAEKMVARVKVYEPDGRLLALVGPEHFDQRCTHLHLAVDGKGRILVADPVRRQIMIFTRAQRA